MTDEVVKGSATNQEGFPTSTVLVLLSIKCLVA